MGDEARETAAQPDVEPQPPLARKRRGREEDLRRVAEIVMVLSAMVEMRAGKEPTGAERALADEARETLARACEEVRPKELFSSEAVRVVVEDLGLNRSKDPVLAFRPPKMSIAERVHHTKKKMEESRDFASSTHASQPHSISFGPSSESHGSQRFTAGKSSPMVLTAGGFPNNSSGVHIPALTSSMSSTKQTPTSEAHSVLVKSSFGKDSPSAGSSVEAVNQRLDARINGPTYFTLVRPTVANYVPEKASVSGISTSAALAAHSQANNLLVNHEIKVLQSSHQMMKVHDTKCPIVQTTQANIAIGNRPSQGLTFVPVASFAGNHSDIAKSIMSVVQARAPDCPNLPPASAEYMTRPLNCQVCKLIITDVESLLVCDACEKGVHLKCLQSQGCKVIPKADWHCLKCLSTSNGKAFPPKYGRVTRNIPAVKATSSGGGSILLEKSWENQEPKLSHQKPSGNDNLGSSGVAQTSNIFSSLEEVTRESNLSNRKEIEEANSNWKKPGEEVNSETSVNPLEENNVVAFPTPAAPSQNTDNQAVLIKLSEAEELEPFLSDSLSKNSEKQPKPSCLLTSEIETSVCQSMSDIKMQLEFLCSNQKHEIDVEIGSQSHLPSDLQVTEQTNVPIIAESTDNLMQKTSIPIPDELEDTSKSSEASTSQLLEVRVEGEHGSEMIHDQDHGNMSNKACFGNSSVEGLHKFDWVGDIIEVLDDRTYYNSCRINGCIIKLHDNVIVCMDNQNFYPAKLLSLWEDDKISSKLALVNEYCFPSTLPESVMQPSTLMQDEVYASDKRNTILASSIAGLCDVLTEDKFREEIDRRTFLADKADGLNSIFLCKWKFDRTNGIFQSCAQFI